MISKYEKKGRFIVQELEEEFKLKQCRHYSIMNRPDIHHFVMNEKLKPSDFRVYVQDVRENKVVNFDIIWDDLAGKLNKETENSDIIFKYFVFPKNEKISSEEEYTNIHIIDHFDDNNKETIRQVKNEEVILNPTLNDDLCYSCDYNLNQNVNFQHNNNYKNGSVVQKSQNINYETL
jgi:hypothetical protein